MKIDSARLTKQLDGGLSPLYVIYGDAPLLQIEAADAIRSTALKSGFTEREVLTCEQGFDWSELFEAAGSLSLFSQKKIVDFRIPSGKVGTEGGQKLQSYCEKLQPDVITLITLPKLDRQGMASKWFEALERVGVAVSANTVARSELPAWVAARLARQNQQADPETLQFLADRVEGNLLAAHQEISKLGLLFSEGKLAFDEVKRAVLDVARYDISQLGEAMLSSDSVRYTRILDGLKGEGFAEPLVLWQISEDIRTLIRVKRAMQDGKPQAQALRDARVWGARQALVLKACRRENLVRLEEMLRHASRIDRMIKGLSRGDIWDELLQLGLDFTVRPKNG